MPYYPTGGDKAYFKNNTSDEKIVADYSNTAITNVNDYDVFTFWGLLHDAVIWNCNKTEKGREYLENAWYYSQDKPDRQGLRAMFGKKGGENNG